ncbi:hypothetical protein SPF06_04805 [Sinomonas sp. JGH33]|uniref:Uncharacterized protein n=1 Tax=Sinomonas terricola TaxID=3110330 RepID=A0ABU5T2Z6_9MICC|nr:hypothetical protein [Sinomonas sp. JGH33]MEA5454038.1 hypothetical protein [Sinomonas sp. JGH33]
MERDAMGMAAKRGGSAGGGCGLLGVFLVLGAVALLLKYWWVVLIVLGVVAVTVGMVRLARTPILPKGTSSAPRPSSPKAIRPPRPRRGAGLSMGLPRAKRSAFDADAFYREQRAKKREEQAAALQGWDRLFHDMQPPIPDPPPAPPAQSMEVGDEPVSVEKPGPMEKPPVEKPVPERPAPLSDPLFGLGYADKFGQTLATGDRVARIEGYAEEIEGAPIEASTGTIVGSGLDRLGRDFARSPALHVQWDIRARRGGYDETMPFHAVPVVFTSGRRFGRAAGGIFVSYYIRKIEDAPKPKKSE